MEKQAHKKILALISAILVQPIKNILKKSS